MIKKLLTVAVFLATATTTQAATYLPTGPQNDVAKSTVANGGWSVVWSDTYAATDIELAPIFADVNTRIMLASGEVGSANYDLLAWVDASLFLPLQTARNQTVQSNGSEWYKNGFSMGFALAGDSINQSSADTLSANADQRMSWHTNIELGQDFNAPASLISFGWRSGTNTNLNVATDWERFILTDAAMAPIPLPAAAWMLLSALGGLGFIARRRNAA